MALKLTALPIRLIVFYPQPSKLQIGIVLKKILINIPWVCLTSFYNVFPLRLNIPSRYKVKTTPAADHSSPFAFVAVIRLN